MRGLPTGEYAVGCAAWRRDGVIVGIDGRWERRIRRTWRAAATDAKSKGCYMRYYPSRGKAVAAHPQGSLPQAGLPCSRMPRGNSPTTTTRPERADASRYQLDARAAIALARSELSCSPLGRTSTKGFLSVLLGSVCGSESAQP